MRERFKPPIDQLFQNPDDVEYGKRWLEKQPKGMETQVRENIKNQAKYGKLQISVGNRGLTETMKEKLSAYRLLAIEEGYYVGIFHFSKGMAVADIKRVEPQAENLDNPQMQIGKPEQKRPGRELSGSGSWEIHINKTTGEEDGVKDTEKGILYRFNNGESFVLQKGATTVGRKPFVRLSNGKMITFEQWRESKNEKNKEIFEQADPGYAELYRLILKEYPEMSQLIVKLGNEKANSTLASTGGLWSRPTESEPHPSITVQMSNEKHYQELMIKRELSARQAAKDLDISFEALKLNPKILKYFIFLHEVGHAHEYITQYYNNPQYDFDAIKAAQANEKKRETEMETLPIPKTNPVTARNMYRRGELQKFYETYKEYYKQRNINSPEELLEKNEQAYRNLPTEVYADKFAAEFLKKKKEKLE